MNQRQNPSSNSNNPPDTLSQQLRESWFTVLIGCLLYTTGICLLFWNEGKAVRVAHSLDEALNNVVELPNSGKSSTEYEDRLIYLSGPIEVMEPLTEPEYGIIIDSIKLKRRVQMFQWIEIKEERFDAIDDYYYTAEWRDNLVDSDHFYITLGHENPKEMPIRSQVQIAAEVKIGDFYLGIELKKKFNDYVEITSDERPERRDIKMHAGLYYHGDDLWNPKIGDLRIQFSYAGKAGDVYTVVGKLVNGEIQPYITTHGEEILLQKKNEVGINQIFHLEHVTNYWRTWKLRGLGWFLIFIATTYTAKFLKTIIINSNLLRNLIDIGTLNLSVSISVSLLIIGLAWIWYRPIVGLCLALASISPFLYSTIFGDTPSSPRHRDERGRLLN